MLIFHIYKKYNHRSSSGPVVKNLNKKYYFICNRGDLIHSDEDDLLRVDVPEPYGHQRLTFFHGNRAC